MNSMQYSDNLCQAIEIIANNVVRGLSFDKTILCTVTNNLKAKQGEYSVSDGASTFTAFSTDQTLKLKDQVYVLIPNGSHQSQKIIVSKYNSKTDSDKGYSMPIDTIIPVEKLSLPTASQGEIGIIANNSNRQQAGEFIINPNNTEYSELSFGPSYTRFSVTGKFKTDLTSVVQGDYSIVIILNGEDVNTQGRKDKKYIFNCSDFFGNPYQLITYTEQSIVFDISDFKKINTINIRFQESGNFYNTEGDLYPTSDVDNLFVKDLEVVFGFDVNEFENNDLLITSKKDLLYNTEGEKNVKLNWVRTRNNNTLFGIDSEADISLTNYNYLRHLQRESPDPGEDPKYYEGKSKSYISMYWYNYVLENIPTDLLLKEDLWKVTNHYNNYFYPSSSLNGSTENTDIFQFKFNPSITIPREKVKAVVAISGCLSKKVLKTQEIEINNGIQEVVLLNTEEDSDGNLIPGLPSYDYIYYSPEDEINVSEIFDNVDTEEFKAYYMNSDNEYQENGVYKKEEIEWVQYYKQEELSIKENGTIEYKNGAPVYGGLTFVYLTESQFNTLKDETYTDSQDSSKTVNRYKLELTPLTLLKSNELIFINNNSNHSYEKLNLINNMKLDCLDNSKGRYFIYRLDNTIPLNAANNGNRRIQASFNSINSVDVKTDNIKIQWKIPKNNTMITKPNRIELDANLYEGVRGKINPDNPDETEKESIITWTETSTHWVSNEITIKNTASGDGVDGTQVITMSIPYQIKSYYSPSFINNKIICLAKKVVNGATEEDITINEKEFELLFGPSGTNGTSYTLTLSFGEEYDNNFNIISNEKQSFLRRGTNESTSPWVLIEAHLFDGDNQVLDSSLNVNFTWYVDPTYDSENDKTAVNLNTSRGASNQCFIKSAYDESSNNFSATQYCAILQASITYQGKQLTSYLPIPMCFCSSVYGFEGPDKIIYNSNGTSPQYYKNELKIFNQNNEEIRNSNYHYWIYINREYSGDLSGKEQKFYPQVIKDEDTNAYHLVAPEIFYQNTSKIICLRLRNKNTTETVFMQPILILQNQFGNSMLNDWDGNLLIDEENNSVLAAQIAAGTKDSKNTFTGVLMGSVSEKDTDDSTPKSGLYGYHQGALSFGFKEDGTAFIGKSGRGRIEFNGNNGTITSSNWTTNNLGMHLNLDTGIAQFKNAGGFVKIDPSQASKIFQIQSANGNILMNVGTDNYYLQSSNYEYQKSGFKMNCGTGGFSLSVPQNTESSTAGGLILSSSSPYLQITKNREQLTENITLEEEGISINSEIYFNPWGSGIIIRDLDTNKFYWGKFVNRTGTTPWVPKDIPFFMEKHSTFSMKSNDGKSTYTGNIYQVLGQTAIDNFYNYFKLKETINKKNLITMSSSGTYSFDSTNKIVKAKDTEAKDGKKYTLEYRLAKFPNCKQTNHYQNCNVELGGHFNSLAYNQEKNILFLAPAGKAAGGYTNPGFIFSFQYDKSDKVWSWKKYHLYNGTAQFTSSIWQVAIDHNEPNILYALNNNGKIFSFEITTGEYKKNEHENITVRKTEIQFTNITSANGKYDDKTYTYQGMAVDNKNFYIPCFKGSYTSQWLWVISRTSTTAKYIEFKGMDTNCEIEEIAFDDQGYMYVAAGYTYGGKLQRGVKIYKVAFNPNSLPNTISLGNPVYIIANSSGTYNVCQGFTLGYDKTQKQSFFAFGFKQADSVNDTLRGRIQINYFNEIESLKEPALEKTILLNIASNSYYLQSQNYQYIDVGNVGNKGVKLDLKSGKLNAYSFNIQLGKNDGSYIKIDSGASKTPIQVYGPKNEDGDRKRCVIGWNGVLTAEGADITGTITANDGKIGNWTLTGKHFSYGSGITSTGSGDNIVYNGVFSNNKAFIAPGGVKASNAGANTPFKGNNANTEFVLGIGSRFGVTTHGTLCASSAIIEGTITATSIILTNDSIDTIQKGCVTADYIQALSLSVGEGGITLSPNAKISWSTQVTGKPTILSKSDVTTITNTTIKTTNVTAQNLKVSAANVSGTLSAAYIDAGHISSGTLTGREINNGNGTFYVSSQGNVTATSGYIGNWQLVDGGLRCDKYDSAIGTTFRAWLHVPGYYPSEGDYLWVYSVQYEGTDKKYYPNFYADTQGEVYYWKLTQGSDKRLKKNIEGISEKYETFFQKLKPVTYSLKEEETINCGFIAQDVLQSLKESELEVELSKFYSTSKPLSPYIPADDVQYNLSYTEFIALNTHMIQKCLKRIDELENEIKTLKAQL